MFAIIRRLVKMFKSVEVFALVLICGFSLPAAAEQYTFPGKLPSGCENNTPGNYTCGALALAAGDVVSFGALPTTITFQGPLAVGANISVNPEGSPEGLTLIVKGGFALGANSVVNASVQTLGAGDVAMDADSKVTGAISTQTGSVTVGARANVGGAITTTIGFVALGVNSTVGGGITTTTGYVSLGVSAVVNGIVTTGEAGYVVMGAYSQIIGGINVVGAGYATVGAFATVVGDIKTTKDAITMDQDSQLTGSAEVREVGAFTAGAGARVGQDVTTNNGGQTYGADSSIGGVASVNGTGAITVGNGAVIFAVCCKGTGASCSSTSTGPAPLTCPVRSPTAFECLQPGAEYNNALNKLGPKNRLFTKLSGTAFTLDVVALKADGTIIQNFPQAASQSVQLEFVIGNGTATTCGSRVVAESSASQPLTFDVSGPARKTATVKLESSHANLLCRVTTIINGTRLVGCSTDNFSVRPSAVVLQAAPTATAPSSISRPAIAAGANFALSASTTAGSNYSGQLVLDTNKLTAQISSKDTEVQNGGEVGLLQPSTLQANVANLLGNYGEVGYLYLAPGAYRDDEFTAIDSASGDCITRTTNNENLSDTLIDGKYGCSVGNKTPTTWGRFYPDHFEIKPTLLTAACSTLTPYTYFGQDGLTTRFSMAAKNTLGETTKNYSGAFAKFNLNNYSAYGFNAEQKLPEGSVFSGSIELPKGAWTDGTAEVVAKHQISRPNKPTAETIITLTASPLDGDFATNVAAISVVPIAANVRLRYGRLQFKNAYGSELLALPVLLEAQYWTEAGYYITNADDSCTVVSPGTIAMRKYTGKLAPCKTQISPAQAFNLKSGKLPNAGIVLTKPGVASGGSLDLSISLGSTPSGSSTCLISATESLAAAANQPWFGSDPTARATFGIYKSKKIYTRENY